MEVKKKMIYSYKFDNDSIYIPIHLNVIFNSKTLVFHQDDISSDLAREIYEFLKEQKEKYIILDFNRIAMISSRSFEIYAHLIKSGYEILFINLFNACKSILQEDDIKEYIEDDKQSSNNFLYSKDFSKTRKEVYCKYECDNQINIATSKIIAEYLFNNKYDEYKKLESTNVYSNMYFNVKSIFYDTHILTLTIYKLCQIIMSRFNLSNIDYFISASHNGSVISSLVAHVLDKEYLYLINLGPQLNLHNKEIINEIKKDKNYIFIYDFICLGTEIKIAKTIIELKEANLIGAIGISNYSKPELDIVISPIFYINDEKVLNFEYKIEVKE